MVISVGTTLDEMEQLKALTAKKNIKELVGKECTVEEMFILLPDEGSEDDRTRTAIKVDGQYYTGISEHVLKTVQELIHWHMNRPEDAAPVQFKVKIEKTAGRYGKIDMYLI